MMPRRGQAPYLILQAALEAPGTFWQLCERAGVDVESRGDETRVRRLFESAVRQGHLKADGIIYSLTEPVRIRLAGKPIPYAGQVAGPAYRGTPHPAPVTIIRRPSIRSIHK